MSLDETYVLSLDIPLAKLIAFGYNQAEISAKGLRRPLKGTCANVLYCMWHSERG